MSACPGSFPAFAVADSVGLLAWRNCAARPSRPAKSRAVARAEFFPPYSRAAATVFHRLPGTESAAIVAERCASRLCLGIALLRVNDLAGRQNWRAPHNKTHSILVAPTFRWSSAHFEKCPSKGGRYINRIVFLCGARHFGRSVRSFTRSNAASRPNQGAQRSATSTADSVPGRRCKTVAAARL